MNRRVKRILFMAALGVSVCLSTSCSKKEGSNAKVVFTTGFGKDEIFRIGDAVCEKPELMVYLSTMKNQYEGVFGAGIWDTSIDGVKLEQNVKDRALEDLAQIKVMVLMAKERGVELSETEQENAAKSAKEYEQSLGEKGMESLGVDADVVLKMYQEYALANKLYNTIIGEVNPEISDDEARIITVSHIFLKTYSKDEAGNKVPFSAEKKQKVYEKAVEIQKKALEPEQDFGALAAEYSDDSNLSYSFGKGEMDINFEKAAFMLDNNAISDVVESENGYHIIKCLSTYEKEGTEKNKVVLIEKRKREAFNSEYRAFLENLAKSVNESAVEEINLMADGQVHSLGFFELYDKYFTISAMIR